MQTTSENRRFRPWPALAATVLGFLGSGCVATQLQLAADHPARAAVTAPAEPAALRRSDVTEAAETPSQASDSSHAHPPAPLEHAHPAAGPAEPHDAH